MRVLLWLAPFIFFSGFCRGQGNASPAADKEGQRAFAEPASKVQAALDKLQPTLSGPLPTLEGFVVSGKKSLDQYRRPYYQCTVRVTPATSGGAVVRVTGKITAWRENSPHPGYEILQSNGRLESDVLDRLQEALMPKAAANAKADPAPDISAPMPQLPKSAGTISAPNITKEDSPLREEARSLEEVLRNQSHPTNLLAVKLDQAPVLESPRADAKVLFLASAEDEFEILDVNPEWVHVRISGLSRGWLRRSAVEMLDGSKLSQTQTTLATQKPPEPPTAESNSQFSVGSEEVGVFPGDWAPLKGKSTRIISVQQAPGSRITSSHDKLQFASSVLRKEVLSAGVDGLVLIFDAEDGGMVASTRDTLDQWKRGTISEASFWKQCFLDPPEILGATN